VAVHGFLVTVLCTAAPNLNSFADAFLKERKYVRSKIEGNAMFCYIFVVYLHYICHL
jgi:hypothetical protein